MTVNTEIEAMATALTWSDNSGKTTYGVKASCDVLIIVSECESQPGPEVVLRRPACELTEEWREKLENQGIAREHQDDDLSIVKARYARDSNYTIAGVEMCSEGLTRDRVLDKIKAVMSGTRGVDLYYIGAGRKGTGDWCFEDGFITFRDLMDLYLQHMRGRVLGINSDCSHSGSWVDQSQTFLDEQEVKPCGHSAKDKGILVVVYPSCLSYQVPRKLAFSTNGCRNEKNTGMYVIRTSNGKPLPITDKQHSIGQNYTQVRCGAEDISSPCLCLLDADWKKWSKLNRIIPFHDSEMWALVVLADDKALVDLLETGSIEEGISEILMIGEGEELSKDEYQAATEKYAVYQSRID